MHVATLFAFMVTRWLNLIRTQKALLYSPAGCPRCWGPQQQNGENKVWQRFPCRGTCFLVTTTRGREQDRRARRRLPQHATYLIYHRHTCAPAVHSATKCLHRRNSGCHAGRVPPLFSGRVCVPLSLGAIVRAGVESTWEHDPNCSWALNAVSLRALGVPHNANGRNA